MFRLLLQKAVDMIWENVEWKQEIVEDSYIIRFSGKDYKKKLESTIKCLEIQGKKFVVYEDAKRKSCVIRVFYVATRLVPDFPRDRDFKRALRNELLQFWRNRTAYASHYVDSAIRTAYWILQSWKENYLDGRFKKRKPKIKKLFARIKNSLFSWNGKILRLTVIPRERYLVFDLSNTWFIERTEGWKLGEIILKENELILMFSKEKEEIPSRGIIAWDSNKYSLDGFGDIGYVKIDIKQLYTIHITYHNIRRKLQQLLRKTPKTARKLLKKYNERERNRVKDFINKITTQISKKFGEYVHCFEKLQKQGMFDWSKKHNRDISVINWRTIKQKLEYKVIKMREINPKYSTKTCSRCGSRNTTIKNGEVICRDCGLRIDRQLNASINLFLRAKN